MKNMILLLTMHVLFSTAAHAENDCFLAKSNDVVIQQQGDCAARHPPCSTFKIPISVMGYDDGFLIDPTHPELPFQPGYVDWMENWKQPHHPTTWMQHSCVWYSHVITRHLGMEKFSAYVHKFNYGNGDVSGDAGQNNGLTRAWLSSSLRISPEEQIGFLQKLLKNSLPVSQRSQDMTKAILFVEDLPHGWKLFGKTGSGTPFDAQGTRMSDRQLGWFVGWIQKAQHTIVFAQYIETSAKEEPSGGKQAKAMAKEKLRQIIAAQKGSSRKAAKTQRTREAL